MPPRKARASVSVATPKTARNKNRKRNLDAYAIASHTVPNKTGPRHRLGEILDDRPLQKRQRPASDDSSDDESAEENIPAKRRKQSAGADDEEDGSDSEGNEWTLGGLREDDEDSELDSDEAFDEEDEERFAGYTFGGSSSAGKKATRGRRQDEDDVEDIDLDEDDAIDDGEEDDFGDEGVDLATMLDNDGSDEEMGDQEGGESDGEDDDAESESDSSQDEDEEDDALNEERIARMRDRLEALDSHTTSTAQAPPQRSTGLTMEALLAASGNSPAVKEAARASKKAKPFDAPLPQRQQDRINRKVASQKANEQLDRWLPTVKQRREAEHLMFPLVDPERSEPQGKDKFVNSEKPQNEFEKAMHDILEQSGMVGDAKMEENEDGGMNAEGLVENRPSLQEVMDRRAELRRRRDILFDAERKAKRISKIKSKAYRRVHRRERQRHAELEREMAGSGDENENEREIAERKRAEARMSTKARDSKWAKSLKASNRTIWDTEARDSVHENARRKEELRRRVTGKDVNRQSSDENSEDDSQEDEDGQMLKQLNRISGDGRSDEKANGLAGLDFMRAADERQRKRNEEDIERLRKELTVEAGDEPEEDEAEGDVDDQGLGRAVFGPKAKEQSSRGKRVEKAELEEGEDSEESEAEGEAKEIITNAPNKSLSSGTSRIVERSSVNGHASKQSKHNATNDDQAKTSDMGGWFTKSSKADKLKLARAPEFSRHESPEQSENILGRAPQADRKAAEQDVTASNTNGWTTVTYNTSHEDDNDSASEADQPDAVLTKQQQRSEFHRRAFAGDNVKKTFDAEKAEAVQAEDEQEISNHLPGWGSWTGAGLTKPIKKSNARARHNPLYKTKLPGIKAEDRKDAKLENVIISEKSDRKGKKYQADLLPHVFETKHQYERSLRVPMGPEWVTKETHQRATKPRVLVKPGVVIGAMEKPIV